MRCLHPAEPPPRSVSVGEGGSPNRNPPTVDATPVPGSCLWPLTWDYRAAISARGWPGHGSDVEVLIVSRALPCPAIPLGAPGAMEVHRPPGVAWPSPYVFGLSMSTGAMSLMSVIGSHTRDMAVPFIVLRSPVLDLATEWCQGIISAETPPRTPTLAYAFASLISATRSSSRAYEAKRSVVSVARISSSVASCTSATAGFVSDSGSMPWVAVAQARRSRAAAAMIAPVSGI